MIRVLLVDDEQPARERLRQILGGFDDVEVVGEASDGEQAVERIMQLRPDVVLLDIQMPGCNGTEVAASLSSPRPKIIFCTAYDEYAVDAFELNAVDYLLKPVSRARLKKALERVHDSTDQARDVSIDTAVQASGVFPTRFLAQRGRHFCVVPKQDVLYFASDRSQTKLQTAERHYWMQPALVDLERRLDPATFFRVSRAVIVNLDAIREVQHVDGGLGEVELTDGNRLEVSRRRFKEMLTRLQK